MAYGARLLSGLRVTPSRGFKSRHLRRTRTTLRPRHHDGCGVVGASRVRPTCRARPVSTVEYSGDAAQLLRWLHNYATMWLASRANERTDVSVK